MFGPKVDSTHKHWVVDTESPSVTAFSGFPMCIPYSGNTDRCLQSNRGAGQAFRPADPLRMVPFAVGDFIEYSGLRIGENEMLVSDIVCTSLHITTTASATEPNYIRVEEFLVGVADTAPNVEVADIRAVGFLSSCAGSNVVISAIDVDPCTGEETYREIASGTPKQETRCRFDIRVTSPSRAPFTREYRITTNGAIIKTKDGIEAGQYVTPVTEWIFPEVDTPGTFPPPYSFTGIQGLIQGDFLDGKQFPPLSPFPGAAPPAPSKTCSPNDIPDPNAPSDPNATPVAFSQQFSATARVGTQVALSATNNNTAISAAHLSYQWKQVSPTTPVATLSNNKTSKPTFLAPKISAQTNFKFNVTICNTGNSTTPTNNANQKCSTASTSLNISPSAADAVTIDRYTWASRQSGTIDVQCSSNVKNGDNKGMTLLLNGSTRLAMTKGSNEGVWTYGSRSVSKPTNLKCVSDLGGESVQKAGTDTTAKKREVFRT